MSAEPKPAMIVIGGQHEPRDSIYSARCSICLTRHRVSGATAALIGVNNTAPAPVPVVCRQCAARALRAVQEQSGAIDVHEIGMAEGTRRLHPNG